MKLLTVTILTIFATGCAHKVAIKTPEGKVVKYQRKAFDAGFAEAERSFTEMMTTDHKARGFKSAEEAYKSCISTIVRVGRLNTGYRIEAEKRKP